MLEAFFVATATTGLFALAKGIRGGQKLRINPSFVMSSRDERGDDLPCPWCYAPTEARDSRCTGCGRTFG